MTNVHRQQQQQFVRDWIGHNVVDDSGSKIGPIDEVYLDDASGQPEWFAIRTGWFGRKLTFVPIAGATSRGDEMCLPYSKETVKGAPKVDPEGHLEASDEEELYRYYGRTAEPPRGRREHTVEGRGQKRHAGEAMTLSEEEITADKVSREAGRARLRKYVVTDEVTLTVPVQREEARVVREPIEGTGRAGGEHHIGDEEREVVLREEQVVAQKKVVPKEKVRLEKNTVTEDKKIADVVRKERVDLEGDRHNKRNNRSL